MLHRLILPALCLSLWAAPSWAQSPDATIPADPLTAAADEAPAAPEQILVVGQKPGPGMWKVSKGDHVLWIFATYAPLPKNMQWRSHEVEAAIARSQEYLAPPGAKAAPGFFKAVSLLPHLIGVRKNPDGARLRDLMPPEEYARWTEMKTKYMPDNDDAERERPVFAAESLARAARRQAGLDNDQAVYKRIAELVKKNKLKHTTSVVDLPMDNAGTMLKNFKKTTLKDVACLSKTMATLETDIAESSARANAWAKGDLEAIRKLDFVEREQACFGSVFDSAIFDSEPAFKNMRVLMRQKWVAAAENALANNASTFALMTMKDVLAPDGVMPALAAKGYTIEQPE